MNNTKQDIESIHLKNICNSKVNINDIFTKFVKFFEEKMSGNQAFKYSSRNIQGVPLEYSFYLFDSNNCGVLFYVQYQTIISILNKLGLNLSQTEADIIFCNMDNNRKGYVTELDYDNSIKSLYLSLFKRKLSIKLVFKYLFRMK